MALKRRQFLTFLGVGAGSVTLQPFVQDGLKVSLPFQGSPALADLSSDPTTGNSLSFTPVKGPMPLKTDRLSSDKQLTDYSQYTVVDDLVLPDGFTYDMVAAWGDRIGTSDMAGL
jgi:hypothetical protein